MLQFLTTGDVPDTGSAVVAGADKLFAIRRDRQVLNQFRVTTENLDGLPGLNVPLADRLVHTGGKDEFPVRQEYAARHQVCVTAEDLQPRACLAVKELGRTVFDTDQQLLIVRGQSDILHLIREFEQSQLSLIW